VNILKSIFPLTVPSLSPIDAHRRLIEENPPLVLDVRMENEFVSGHIKGAKHIPLNDLDQIMSQLPKDREIMCVCHSGIRSNIAAGRLHRAGYRVFNMRGGMMGWEQANLPIHN
jgi:rhodanese-related sulfurtransferase